MTRGRLTRMLWVDDRGAATLKPRRSQLARNKIEASPDVFAALANPLRRQMLMALRGGPLTSSELTRALPVSRPSAVEQLQVLRENGLVRAERRGRERLYYLDPRPLTDVGSWLNGVLAHWTRRLDDLEAAARRERAAR